MENSTKKVPCQIMSRVVGYYSSTDHFNKGKREEFNERKTYDINLAMEKMNELP